MDPRWLFPALALAFALASLQRWTRTRRWAGAVTTWAWLALTFAAVSLWLFAHS